MAEKIILYLSNYWTIDIDETINAYQNVNTDGMLKCSALDEPTKDRILDNLETMHEDADEEKKSKCLHGICLRSTRYYREKEPVPMKFGFRALLSYDHKNTDLTEKCRGKRVYMHKIKEIGGIGDIKKYSDTWEYNYGNNDTVNWYIDFYNSLFTIGFDEGDTTGEKGTIVVKSRLGMGKEIFKLNLKYLNSEGEDVHFFKLSRDEGSNSSVYIQDAIDESVTAPDEGPLVHDIVKITFLRDQNKIKFENSTLYPNMILKVTASAENGISPKSDALFKLVNLLTKLGKILFNAKKIQYGAQFKILKDENALKKIEIKLAKDLEAIYGLLIDYLPEEPKIEDDDEETVVNTPIVESFSNIPEPISTLTPDQISLKNKIKNILTNYSENYLKIISEKIDTFLKETCNIKTQEERDNVEKEKYINFYNNASNTYSKNKLPRDLAKVIILEETELKTFCENSELGKVKPNNDLKNTAILVNGYFQDIENGDLYPRIANEYSEDYSDELFTFKAEVSEDYPEYGYCLDSNTFNEDFFVYPEDSEIKKCDARNFKNSDEILGVCNIENKNLLENICISYGAKMEGSGYPETRCKISHLNKLTEDCNNFGNPTVKDCTDNNFLLPGCNRYAKNPNVKPLVKSYPSKIINISETGACNTMAKYTNQTKLINEQTNINRKKIEEHTKKRDEILKHAEDINLIHKMDQNAHESNIEFAKERNEDITKARICTAKRRKYDYKANKCTDQFLDPIPDPNEAEWRKCIQEQTDLEAFSNIKITAYITFFTILLFIIVYFTLVRN